MTSLRAGCAPGCAPASYGLESAPGPARAVPKAKVTVAGACAGAIRAMLFPRLTVRRELVAAVLPDDRAPRGMNLTPGVGSTEERYARLIAWLRQHLPDAAAQRACVATGFAGWGTTGGVRHFFGDRISGDGADAIRDAPPGGAVVRVGAGPRDAEGALRALSARCAPLGCPVRSRFAVDRPNGERRR